MTGRSEVPGTVCEIPRFTIDLALPPRQRYVQLASAYAERLGELVVLLRDVVDLLVPPVVPAAVHGSAVAAALLLLRVLRRLRSAEQTEELRGIAAAAGLPLYTLVAFKVLLDALCGCTSGAVPVAAAQAADPPGRDVPAVRLMHFRTLDWGMRPLRDFLVRLDFVHSASSAPDQVLATSISYVGFVGFLTAVRQDLSISLNFRPVHQCSTLRLHWNAILVALGFRNSIASTLRLLLLEKVVDRRHGRRSKSRRADSKAEAEATVQGLRDRAVALARKPSAPCYIVLCDGSDAVAIEKDVRGGRIRVPCSAGFIAQTNHDVAGSTVDPPPASRLGLMDEDWLAESGARLDQVEDR